jgi:hypothetical protein
MNDILQRLSTIIEKHYNNSRPDFARAVGKSPDTLRGYFIKDSKPGSDFLLEILQLGYNPNWLISGEGSMYADNESGKALQRKADGMNGVPKKNQMPEWAMTKAIQKKERLQTVQTILGGLEKMSMIFGMPAEDVEKYIEGENGRVYLWQEASKLGFSLDWLMMGMFPYHNNSEEGLALKEAVETDTLGDWAEKHFRTAFLQQEQLRVPRTFEGRVALVRVWFSEYFGFPHTFEAFAKFLTESEHNTVKYQFTADDVEKWGKTARQSAVNILMNEGIDIFWLTTGDDDAIFGANANGERLAAWYEERLARKNETATQHHAVPDSV